VQLYREDGPDREYSILKPGTHKGPTPGDGAADVGVGPGAQRNVVARGEAGWCGALVGARAGAMRNVVARSGAERWRGPCGCLHG
jgi:hypothetical protein